MKKQLVNTDHDLRLLELRRELRDTARDLHYAYDRFNYVTDPGLIEAGIYDINALKSRYDFLLRKMKLAQGQAAPSRCPEPLPAEPACMPAGNVKGGPSCPS